MGWSFKFFLLLLLLLLGVFGLSLFLLKLKHCSEIIFKCVNSTVGSIFNKKVAKKCNLWDREQCINVLFTVDKVNYCGLNQKNKKRKRKMQLQNVEAGIIVIQMVMLLLFRKFGLKLYLGKRGGELYFILFYYFFWDVVTWILFRHI